MPVNQTGTITVKILAQDLASGNIGKFIGSLDKAAKQSGLLGWAVRGTAMSMGSMLNPAALVAGGIGRVTDALADSVKAFNDDALSQKKLQTSLEANIAGWDGNTKAIEDLIASRMRLGFSDDQQRDSLALIVAQVEDVNDALAIQRTAMDLARLKSMDLADASTLLAKAYLGSATGLQKMGIRLGKGVDGMEAIEAVQKRAAGQAEAYTRTMVGAADVMAVSFDEFKESVGGALTGALTPFFNLVVDLANQAPNLDSAMGRLTQKYRDMVETKAEAIKQDDNWDDEVTSLLRGVFMPQDQAISDYVDRHREMVMALGVSRKEFALFAEAALTAGLSWDEITAKVRQLQGEVGATAVVVSGTWTGAVEKMVEAGLTFDEAVAGMKRAVRDAVRGTLTTMDDMKGPWQEAWIEYAEYAKDPFSEKNFARYMQRFSNRAAKKAEEAAANHKGAVSRKWTELANAAKDPVVIAMARITGDVLGAIGVIATLKQQTAGLDNIMPSLTSVFGNDNDGRPRGHWKQTKNGVKWVEGRASGGPVMPGRTYRVGEAGEETLHMSAGGGGYVVPGARGRESSGGGNHVHLHFHGVVAAPSEAEGARLARVVAPHLQRELSRAGF